MKPRFFVYQKLTAIINRYRVFDIGPDEKPGSLRCFVEQKRGKLKEVVKFYKDEDKKEVLFSFRAEKVMDVHGKYFVEDTDGKLIGYLKKDFSKSFIKSTWYIYSSKDTKLLSVTESSTALALARRYTGFIPILGELIEAFLIIIKYHFVFYKDEPNEHVGKFQRISIWRDRYTLFADDKTYDHIDERLFLALGVALDALQSR